MCLICSLLLQVHAKCSVRPCRHRVAYETKTMNPLNQNIIWYLYFWILRDNMVPSVRKLTDHNAQSGRSRSKMIFDFNTVQHLWTGRRMIPCREASLQWFETCCNFHNNVWSQTVWSFPPQTPPCCTLNFFAEAKPGERVVNRHDLGFLYFYCAVINSLLVYVQWKTFQVTD